MSNYLTNQLYLKEKMKNKINKVDLIQYRFLHRKILFQMQVHKIFHKIPKRRKQGLKNFNSL